MLTKQIIQHAAPRERVFKLFDGGGLFLLVRPTGLHGWRFKYRVRGREKLLSFGPYPAVSLANARAQCKAAKALLRDGVDPSVSRQAAKHGGADSFEAIAREWYGTHSIRWKPSYQEHIIRRLERDIFPWIGHKAIHAIGPADLL